MQFFYWKLPTVFHHPNNFSVSLMKVDIKIFQIFTEPVVGLLEKGSCGFNSGSLSRQLSTLPSFISMGPQQMEI